MSNITFLDKPTKQVVSSHQKMFLRLQKKIEVFQNKILHLTQELDHCLNFFHTQVDPKQQELAGIFKKIILIFYTHYKSLKRLSKKDRKILKELISHKAQAFLNLTSINNKDPEIQKIILDIEGVDYQKVAAGEINTLKAEVEMFFSDQGIDVDLCDIQSDDSEAEIMRKIMEAMLNAKENYENEPTAKPKAKSKKEIEKEQKLQKIESIQKQGLSSIYKQLAKAFHPDLEQDLSEKSKKEILMKQLTTAYENKDLYKLLQLEIEWMNMSNKVRQSQSDDQIKVYNSILKDQVHILQKEIETLAMHPKYFVISKFLDYSSVSCMFELNAFYKRINQDCFNFQQALVDLEGDNSENVLRGIIASCY